jgi:hypothetical protein
MCNKALRAFQVDWICFRRCRLLCIGATMQEDVKLNCIEDYDDAQKYVLLVLQRYERTEIMEN